VKTLFNTYRALAFVVGVLLLLGTLDIILKYGFSDGSGPQRFGSDFSWIWVFHGWIFIVYVIVAFILTQRAKWSIPQFLVMMISGLIPVTIFFVEHFAAKRLRAQYPELGA
jgi:integral membrane protein